MSDVSPTLHGGRQEPTFDVADDVEDVVVRQDTPLFLADGQAVSAVSPAPKKSFIGKLFRKSTVAPESGSKRKPSKPHKAESPASVPIQVLMGYLPEVSERDALEYAMGIADKYVTQVGLAFYAATKFGGGYIYEVHEGGSGKAFGPELVRHFTEAGPYQADAPQVVHIKTAQRMVEVTRERDSVGVVLLPDDAEVQSPDWLRPRKAMTPGIPRRKGMLYAGVGLLISGTIAAGLTGAFFRLQGYALAPDQPVVAVSADVLPSQQWNQVRSVPLEPGEYVKALRYKDGKWQEPERSSIEEDAIAAEAALAAESKEPKEPKE